MIRSCGAEATRWIEVSVGLVKNDTFYLCPDHAEVLSPNDNQVSTLIPSEGRIEVKDLAVYACSDKCRVCNDF